MIILGWMSPAILLLGLGKWAVPVESEGAVTVMAKNSVAGRE
jgi:hypothetical protein